jgi:hypothetical protein
VTREGAPWPDATHGKTTIMDDAEFSKQLDALDKGIAERWKKVSSGSLKKKLGVKELVEILGPVFRADKIDAKQARAALVISAWAEITPDAFRSFLVWVEDAYVSGQFFRGSAVRLASDDKLKDVYAALGATGVIDFVSPDTGFAYSADQYAAVRRLVADGKIEVYEADAGGLGTKGGEYRSNVDRLVVYKRVSGQPMRYTIIHEATHAIQDWNDVRTKNKYAEADAFIAEGAVALSVDAKSYRLTGGFDLQMAAAEFVLKKTAVPGNAAWKAAYEAVARAIALSPGYDETANAPFLTRLGEDKKDEKKILGDILREIKGRLPISKGLKSHGSFPVPIGS